MILFSETTRSPEQVIAYHGCSQETAQRILNGDLMRPSINGYDWLGRGIYFWEYAAHRALEWAKRRFDTDAAVLQAEIRLGHCLNLMDIAYFEGMQIAYANVVQVRQAAGRRLPVNTQDKRHFLDRAVIDFFCELWERNGGQPYQTVRGCFPEGEPVFMGSKILRETHIQIAVRDTTCISRIEPVQLS